MAKIGDKLWLWTHEAGCCNDGKLIKDSRITPAEAAFYLGVQNILFVKYGNKPRPSMYEKYSISFTPFKKVVWSIVGDSSSSQDDDINSKDSDVVLIPGLAMQFPNICGVIMDDFFTNRAGTFNPGVLSEIKDKLVAGGRKLDLWVTLYTHELNESIKYHLEQIDVVTFWTWHSEELENLEENFKKLKQVCPQSRKVLGCYMYDFGNNKLMPVDLMEKQCELGLKWLKAGEIEGIIFLSNIICDLKFEAVEWTKQWIQRTGEENI